MDHVKSDFDEENLYYEYVKQRDGFISYRTMRDREKERFKIHLEAMNSLETDNAEFTVAEFTEIFLWRKELARRAHERYIKWSRLHHSHVFIREDHD